MLRERGVITDDIEHVPGGKTFFWAGRYERDVNVRHTLQTDLNVFEHFKPKLSEAAKAADTLFLANIQPELQRAVREQCEASHFSALDSMNLWIDIAHESLLRTIAMVDCVILNDGEVRQLTDEPNLVRAARKVLDAGPAGRRGQAGRVRLGDVHRRRRVRRCPPTRPSDVVDPTGAGDTFAGGFMGYVAAHAGEELTDELLRTAMAYGTALASFNVEAFGTERMQTLTRRGDHRPRRTSCSGSAPSRPRRSSCAPESTRARSARRGSSIPRRGVGDALPVPRVEDPAAAPVLARLLGDQGGAGARGRRRRRRLAQGAAAPGPTLPRAPAPRPARRPAAAAAAARAARSTPARASRSRRNRGCLSGCAAMPTSVLSDGTIRRLVDEGRIVIEPWDPELVQPASVDLRLGDSFRVFHNHRARRSTCASRRRT